jgi:hypothetical protein
MFPSVRNLLNIKELSNVSPTAVLTLATNVRTPALLTLGGSNDRKSNGRLSNVN